MKERMRGSRSYLPLAIAGLLGLFFLQIYTPLRLNTDATAYLAKAAALVEGSPIPYPDWNLPPGYQYLIAALDFAGLGVAWVFVLCNWLFLAIGIAASYRLLSETYSLPETGVLLVTGLVLLSFVMVKHVPLPLPETAFFAATISALWMLSRARTAPGRSSWFYFGGAGMLIATSIALRLIGVALIPAMVWSVWKHLRDRGPEKRISTTWGVAAGVVLVAALLAVALLFVEESFYLDQLYYIYRDHGIVNNLQHALTARLEEIGELALNVPQSQLPAPLEPLVVAVGLIAVGVLVGGLIVRRGSWSEGEIYGAAYVFILLVYTGHATRYWLPVLPLLFAWGAVLAAKMTRFRWGRAAVTLYLIGFTAAGLAAHAYSTRITFAGSKFPDRYGDGTLTETYRVAFDENRVDGPSDVVESQALRVLYRYEPRARGADP